MKMIDAVQNQRAAAALRWLPHFLGTPQRNWLKPITQEELADRLGSKIGVRPHQSMISRYQKGNSLVPPDVLSASAALVAEKLGHHVTVDDLLNLAERGLVPSKEINAPWISLSARAA